MLSAWYSGLNVMVMCRKTELIARYTIFDNHHLLDHVQSGVRKANSMPLAR
jgi:hypothetical protein